MKRILFFVGISVLVTACSKDKQSPTTADSIAASTDTLKIIEPDSIYERFQDFRDYVVKQEVPSEDIQVIDSVSALIVNPTEEQIDRMIKENGDDFATIADDAAYYQSEGVIALDSFGITTIDATKRYIKFVGTSESWLLDIRQPGAPEWNIIFFDPRKKPQVNSWIDINFDELIAYYGRK